jgi:hypothetical protein
VSGKKKVMTGLVVTANVDQKQSTPDKVGYSCAGYMNIERYGGGDTCMWKY